VGGSLGFGHLFGLGFEDLLGLGFWVCSDRLEEVLGVEAVFVEVGLQGIFGELSWMHFDHFDFRF